MCVRVRSTCSADYIMRYLWNPAPYLAMTPSAFQNLVLADWCQRMYAATSGAPDKQATAVAALLDAYFNIPYHASTTNRFGEQVPCVCCCWWCVLDRCWIVLQVPMQHS
jgi:hypothetical protein